MKQHFLAFIRKPPVDGRSADFHQQLCLGIRDVQGLLGAQLGHQIRHGSHQEFESWGTQHGPAQDPAGLQVGGVRGLPSGAYQTWLGLFERFAPGCAGVVAVPASELDEFV